MRLTSTGRTRRTAIVAGVTLAGFAMATPAWAVTSRTQPKAKLGVALMECQTGATELERYASFQASMPAIRKATRMQMRFTLHQRANSRQRFSALLVPDWRKWVRSDPAQPGFLVERRIDSLVAPAHYRVMVEFRWTNAKGRPVKVARRMSKVCKQPERAAPLQ